MVVPASLDATCSVAVPALLVRIVPVWKPSHAHVHVHAQAHIHALCQYNADAPK